LGGQLEEQRRVDSMTLCRTREVQVPSRRRFGSAGLQTTMCASPLPGTGSGPPVVIASCWLSHLQYDWQSPVWRHFLAALGTFATVVRYDERGHGLSDWDVDDFSLPACITDLEAGRGRRPGPFRLAGDVAGRPGRDRLRGAAPGAGEEDGVLRQLRRAHA
jgi:hypothetical protein